MTSVFAFPSSSNPCEFIHNLGESFDFNSSAHQVRLRELFFFSEEKNEIPEETVYMLWLIKNDDEGTRTQTDWKNWIKGHCNDSRRFCEDINWFPGFSNSVLEEMNSSTWTPGRTTHKYPLKRFDYTSIPLLVDRINKYLEQSYMKWDENNDVYPRLEYESGFVNIYPGHCGTTKAEQQKMFMIPIFGKTIELVLGLETIHSDTFKRKLNDLLLSRSAFVSPLHMINPEQSKFYFKLNCNLVETEDYDENNFGGILYSWPRDLANSSRMAHIAGGEEWIDVKRGIFPEIKARISSSSDSPPQTGVGKSLLILEVRRKSS